MKRFAFLLTTFLLLGGAAAADELILMDGKIIRGKIVEETATQIRIRTGPQMNLAIDKSRVRAVNRTGARPEPRAAAPSAKAQPSPVPAPAPANPVRGLAPGAVETSSKKSGATVKQATVISTYTVAGADFDAVSRSIRTSPGRTNPTSVAYIDAGDRRLDFSWTGNVTKGDLGMKWGEVVIDARISLRGPAWLAPAAPDKNAVDQWNAFFADFERHNAGHVAIFKAAVESLAQGLSSLRAEDETKLRAQSAALEKTIRERVARKQEGFDRHAARERENPISKKKK